MTGKLLLFVGVRYGDDPKRKKLDRPAKVLKLERPVPKPIVAGNVQFVAGSDEKLRGLLDEPIYT